jgi:hypothetical protein
MVRIEDDVWADYGQLCEEEGTSRADDIRRHVHARVTAWRKANGLEKPKRVVRVKRRKPAESDD